MSTLWVQKTDSATSAGRWLAAGLPQEIVSHDDGDIHIETASSRGVVPGGRTRALWRFAPEFEQVDAKVCMREWSAGGAGIAFTTKNADYEDSQSASVETVIGFLKTIT